MLDKLEDAGLIQGEWETINPREAGRRPRRSYTLTGEGVRAFEREWQKLFTQGVKQPMAQAERFRNLVHWLTRQLPARPEVREQEWLAELESLTSWAEQTLFMLGCLRAAWRMQPRPLFAGLK